MRLALAVAVAVLVPVSPLWAAEGGELPRIVNFTILAVILALVLRKPIVGFLEAKTEQIRSSLEEAKVKQKRADSERLKADELLARLEAEVERAKEEARQAALAERQRILDAASREAARIEELARKEIEAKVEAGRRKLLAKAADLSVVLAHRKLEAAMTEADHAQLIEKNIAMLEKTR